ncbi:hypothetical protein FM038_008370 [Shewanella eurypsychrophilus]|uniref:Pilus assembly protein FimV n=1 Tax=Shewanella eurypsychrophilus TaxID=2593656 RepID=A0ABX6V471_9GAMM|nr:MULTISPECIES: FimV/HubP family polar landmark protein [Shewanella]QFU22166.1 hypothetical protein FS418_09950 [Shewanella sp. YLB-09]QPG57453.1 hypothetical protein FM038_008370 [Shewanella eurypsychrophilus]
MNFRTSYLVGLMASALLVFTVSPFEQTAFAAEPLKITGPDGEVRQTNRQYGPTQSSDTFWSIAQKVRPDSGVSIYQVMAAIYDANPHAFSNANFNSLEKGMILLIPSKELMLAIPQSMAKARAERDDKGWKKATQPKVEARVEATTPVRPVTLPITAAEAEVAKPTVQTDGLAELTAKLETAEAKNLQLTDELGRAQDQLDVGNSDTDSLKGKIDELNEQVALLEEQLQASKLQGAGLSEEVKALQEQINALQTVEPEQEPDLWRNFMSNPMMLVAAISIPALLVLGLLWLFLRRRRDDGSSDPAEKETEDTPSSAPAAAGIDATAEDTVSAEEVEAIHLDTEGEDSIDSLMSIDTADLQPEIDMSSDEQVDLESEMFVDPGETPSEEEPVEEEGQSLDDLWAEAMGEQDDEEPKTADEDDLDSLLAGFDEPAADEPAVDENVVEDAVELSTPEDVSELVSEDDLDSLLAGFDEPAQAENTEEKSVEPASDIVSEDDLDSLLAGFDESPQAEGSEEDSVEASVEEIAEPVSDTVSEDDLDSLLAGFDESPQAEDSEKESAEPSEDAADVDALLAELDMVSDAEPATAPTVESADDSDLADAISAELESEIDSSEVESEEDLDALLASFDEDKSSTEEVNEQQADLTDAISAELEGEVTESEGSEDELDSLLAEFDITDSGIAETLDKPAADDVDALLSIDTGADESGSKDEALDSLLADLESVDPAQAKDPVAVKGSGGMFADLKGGKKTDDNSLDWDSSADIQEPVIAPSSNDELLDPVSERASKVMQDSSELNLALEDETKLTVDEAIAALDVEELSKSPAVAVNEHDLSTFQKDNGFIDIDMLLNEADEDEVEADQYKELDVDMGELDDLMGNAAMVDVDDEENSVNAKLDLARAYIEIDDHDSAKALLKEVQIDGNNRQQDEADGLIKTLD